MKHVFHYTDQFLKNTKIHQLFYPIKEQITYIGFLQYYDMSWRLHESMLIPDQKIMIRDHDDVKWIVGAQNGLENFFSRENKEGLKILLDDYWQKICSQSNIKDTEKNFDDFFDYFATNYLDDAKNKWKYVLPIQNIEDGLNRYENIPIYSILPSLIYDLLKSIYTSFNNYESVNYNLVSEYIEYKNQNSRDKEPETFIESGFRFLEKLKDFIIDNSNVKSWMYVVKQKTKYFQDFLVNGFNNLKEYINILDNSSEIISNDKILVGGLEEHNIEN